MKDLVLPQRNFGNPGKKFGSQIDDDEILRASVSSLCNLEDRNYFNCTFFESNDIEKWGVGVLPFGEKEDGNHWCTHKKQKIETR